MKITDIKQQVKRQGRYSIFVDGAYSFSLSENGLIAAALRIGQELSQQDVEQLKDTSAFDKLYNQALNLISRRMRSEWEILDYAKRKGHDKAVANQLVEQLRERRFLDDVAFARAWVDSRRRLRSASERRLRQELRAKRVASDVIDQVLEADESSDGAMLRELIAKKRKQAKYQDDLKLMQYLSRQGFSYPDIKSAMTNDES